MISKKQFSQFMSHHPSLLDPENLIHWQKHLVGHQHSLFAKKALIKSRYLASEDSYSLGNLYNYATSLDILSISPQNLNFWFWPNECCNGAAIYFVIDHPPHLESPILLYIGETSQAEKRWKGNHACKDYLAAYCEAVHRGKLQENLSIRFWSDVPTDALKRRTIEEILIDFWRPGLNKLIYQRWQNPFLY
uniref:GIY-YIG domain-containing protein n=1 Tax=Paulinella longichromatophora TaxID=1708747 RepID=A0A2H4ZQI9_9EUKA|nr:hypothetical protein PLO_825 [Paulinella longichromatophora]